jgi:phage terminase small subunit
MPRPRQPLAKAIVEGRHLKDPQRYRERTDMAKEPLGDAPKWFDASQITAWEHFRRELGWLTESDRALLEITAPIRASLIDGREVPVNRLNFYRLCLSQLGASPADRSKITMPETEEEDPDDFFYKYGAN